MSSMCRKGESYIGSKKGGAGTTDAGVEEVTVVGGDLVAPDAVAQLKQAAAMPFVRVAAGTHMW